MTPAGPSFGPGVGFLDGALHVAQGLALQRFTGGFEARALARDDGRGAGVQPVAEVDLLAPRIGNGHGGLDGVELAGLECRDQAVEVVADPHALELELGADGVAQVDTEALHAAACCGGFKGRIARVDAKAQFFPFLGADAHGNARNCQ